MAPELRLALLWSVSTERPEQRELSISTLCTMFCCFASQLRQPSLTAIRSPRGALAPRTNRRWALSAVKFSACLQLHVYFLKIDSVLNPQCHDLQMVKTGCYFIGYDETECNLFLFLFFYLEEMSCHVAKCMVKNHGTWGLSS